MALFEGKTSTERNKIIAAAVLGLVALIALFMAFGPRFGGSTTTATTKTTPTPTRSTVSPAVSVNVTALPSADDQTFIRETTPVVYTVGQNAFAPDAGRNIFAFYEPPAPTPYVTPPATPVIIKPPSPTPTPVFLVSFVTPQSIYAGSRGFRLEVNGDRFTPDSRIYFNQIEMPTVFVNAQKLVTDIPANLITQEGPRQIMVQTPDGRAYSDQMILTVQAPPKPGFQYIGMIGRKRYNNDTAYFLEQGKPTPFGARLNDIVSGRFRLVDISPVEVVFEDVNLGFRHPLKISKASATGSSSQPVRGGQPMDGVFQQFDPNLQNIPGIPNNIPRYVPPGAQPQPQPTTKRPNEKKDDVDDNDDGDGFE